MRVQERPLLLTEMRRGHRLLGLGDRARAQDLREPHPRLCEPLHGQRQIGVLLLAADPHEAGKFIARLAFKFIARLAFIGLCPLQLDEAAMETPH